MQTFPIVFFHKDHPLDPQGVNAGAETATIALAKALAQLGCEVIVAAQLPQGVLDQRINGVRYLDLGETFDTQKIFQNLDQDPALEKYHLIVVSRAQALLESRYNKKIISRTFITHEPSAGALGISPKIIGQVADHVVAVSLAQKDALVSHGCAAEVIKVIANGADLDLFRAGDSAQRNYSKLIFVGALVVDKGIHVLLEAFARLGVKYPQLTLDIYGSSQMWGRENFFDIERAKLIPGVNFHGAVSQEKVAVAMKSAGMLVLPSIYFDSFPLTAVEAQVTGLPVVGSVHGGMKEIIIDGVTGVLINEVNVENLVATIEKLVTNPKLLPEMSKNCLQMIRGKFSWEATANQILGLFQTVKLADKGKKMENRVENKKLGLLTTFNQECGLATYAKYLINNFQQENVIVLAEDVDRVEIIAEDQSNVRRCWKRQTTDFIKLAQVIEQENIGILHLNCHYRFFQGQAFSKFLIGQRGKGVKVIAHVHNPYTIDPALQSLIQAADSVIVHTEENKLEVIANGAEEKQVEVIEHGVELVSSNDKTQARAELGIPNSHQVVLCFGFVQAHKGIDEVIQAMQHLQSANPNLHLYIAGFPHKEDTTSQNYFQAIKHLTQQLGLQGKVHFSEGFVAEQLVEKYLVAADVIVMNYRSLYYEASGAIARAIGSTTPVIASTAPAFARLSDAVFHLTSGYPLSLAIELVLTNPELRRVLKKNAAAWAEQYSWLNTGKRFAELYKNLSSGKIELLSQTVSPVKESAKVGQKTLRSPKEPELRVLMQNRANAFSQPGGDTVVMQRTAESLRKKGIRVDIDVEGLKNPIEYDLVHLYNFATPQITEQYARRCIAAKVPYLVTTMYEDLPRFYNQMLAQFRAIQSYVSGGQKRGDWDKLITAAADCHPSSRWENTWTASNSAALIASGGHEKSILERDYPEAKLIRTYRLGCDLSELTDDGTLFFRETGLKDFVFCVGRLETRKNQLMLLKALEDSDLTLVFATGGFTYQPEYEEACRSFKRRGRTEFLGRLDATMLASAYAAAKIHVLPSWYELPGIVSMEAARRGRNIVVSDFGTAKDYFGNLAYYCTPNDADSIYNALIAAYYSPTRHGLAELIADCTWENAGKTVLEIYYEVLDACSSSKRTSYQVPEWDSYDQQSAIIKTIDQASIKAVEASQSVSMLPKAVGGIEVKEGLFLNVEELCQKAEQVLRSGKPDQAEKLFKEVLRMNSKNIFAIRGLAVIELGKKNLLEAEKRFNEALSYDPQDIKSIVGLGACKVDQGKKQEAFEFFLKALANNPTELSALIYLISVAYALNKYTELEQAIHNFLAVEPNNLNIKFCLAGCYYKQGRTKQAYDLVVELLRLNPTDQNALELKATIEQEKPWLGSSEVKVSLSQIKEAKQLAEYPRTIELVDRFLAQSRVEGNEQVEAILLKAESLACLGKLAEANLLFKECITNPVFSHRAFTGLGAVAAAAESWEEAENYFDQALNKLSSDDAAIAGKGICALKMDNTELAWEYFRRALDINPENMRALLGVVQLGYPLKRLDEIETVVVKYLEMHPANLSILYAHAGCCYAKGDVETAVGQLEKIRLFEPNHQLANELLGKIHQEGNQMKTGTI